MGEETNQMLAMDPFFNNEAVTVLNPEGAGSVVLICEHASNHIPDEFNQLGLDAEVAQSHIAWDPGALPLAKALSAAFDAPLVAGAASRLLFDCNRPSFADDAIPVQSEIYQVPGNAGLSQAQRNARITRFHDPFFEALSMVLDAKAPKLVITFHSFTASYRGKQRPVEIGVLHDEDRRFADAMLNVSREYSPFNVQRNDPYGPEDGVTHTLKTHAQPRGMLNVMLEVRNDLLVGAEEQAQMGEILSAWIGDAMAQFGIAVPESRGS